MTENALKMKKTRETHMKSQKVGIRNNPPHVVDYLIHHTCETQMKSQMVGIKNNPPHVVDYSFL